MGEQDAAEALYAQRHAIADHGAGMRGRAVAAVDHHRRTVGKFDDRTVALPHVHDVDAHLALGAERDLRRAGTGAQKLEGKEKEIGDDQRGDDRRNAKGGDGAAHRLPPLCACLRTHGRQPRQPSRERA